MELIKITVGCLRIELNGTVFSGHCQYNTEWRVALKRGVLLVNSETIVDSVNGNTLEFKAYAEYEFNENGTPTLGFLITLFESSPKRINELLDSYLHSLTTLAGNRVLLGETLGTKASLAIQLQNVYGEK